MHAKVAEGSSITYVLLSVGLQVDTLICYSLCHAQDMQRMHKWGSVSSVSLEMGSEDGLQPAQYLCRDRLLCQVTHSL